MAIRQAFLGAASALTLVATCANAADPAVRSESGMLVAPNGMTLYVFDKDTNGGGKSLCNGPCANNWPPLLANADSTSSDDYSVIMRDDGSKQWAYKGKPLYFWAKDLQPGEKNGDGFNNVWKVARP
jgi:predicted lipoprotein with Yx(FWY)xxD motif